MPRYKLKIEYDGSDFVGWQRQKNGITVQEVIEQAVKKYCQTIVIVHGAGRTDTGVHAIGQVAHIDLPKDDDSKIVRNALNAHLRDYAVVILEVNKVNDSFHARFDAYERVYKYYISNRKVPLVIDNNRYWWFPRNINISKMQKACRYLIGKHDFTSFRSSACQAISPVKTINDIKIKNLSEKIEIIFTAPSFLHHQVRNIVGSIAMVGIGKWEPEDIKKVLDAKDRKKAGLSAPACGLYLTSVKYKDDN